MKQSRGRLEVSALQARLGRMTPPSKSQVKKVAHRLRSFYRDEVDREVYDEAIKVLKAYRACFSRPTVIMNNNLRKHAKTAGVEASVTQRLKKVPTIVEKLVFREQNQSLQTMHDIGGCRVVVATLEDLQRMRDVIEDKRRQQLMYVRDYVESPRTSGYRAVHLVLRHGSGYPVEVQLRTRSMHDWAETAESFSNLMGLNLKQDGDHPIQLWLAVVSDIYYHRDRGQKVPRQLRREYNRLMEAAKRSISDAGVVA